MDQGYFDFKAKSEYEPELFIDKGSKKYLNKKRLKAQNRIKEDGNMFLEINKFSNSISKNTISMNFTCPTAPDGFIFDIFDEKYINKTEDIDLSLEDSTKIINSSNSVGIDIFNKEESITENDFSDIQNIPTIIKNKNDSDKKEIKDNPDNIKNNKKIKISDNDYLNYGKRKNQKDNVSLKLFKKFNDWIIKIIENQIPEPLKKKINPPDHDIFTHNTNSKDIRVFLDIQIKNILIMTKNDKESLDHLLIIKGIKKQRKYNETTLNDREFKDAEILLKMLNKIEEKEKMEKNEIINLIIEVLVEKGYKKAKEEKIFFKKDKDNFNHLLSEYNIKKSFKNQEKNEIQIEEMEKLKTIAELKMTLRELLLVFFEGKCNEFEDFKKDVKEINEYFELLNGFSLLELNKSKTSCGFIQMIERDCDIPQDKIKNVNHITNYFINKKINKVEIDKYLELYAEENNDN
jgi:hypothetical protein